MIPETGELDWDDLDRCLTDHRTRLLAIGAASNALGTINDVARAVAMAREAEALSFVDAVHFAPHQLVDVQEWGCDFLACSAYKFHGPHVGVLYGKREQLEALDVPKLQPAPRRCPSGWRPARRTTRGSSARRPRWIISLRSPPDRRLLRRARGASGCGPCSRRFTSAGRRSSNSSGTGCGEIEGVKLFGPPPDAPRTPTLAFTVADQPAAQVSRRLADGAIFASHGDFYAMTVAQRLGVADRRPRPARLCLLHDRRRGRQGHRCRASDRARRE